MNVCYLLGKVEEKPMKLAVKQEKPSQYLKPQKTLSTVSRMVPKIQNALQRHNNGTTTTRTINNTKRKNVTFERSNMMYTATDKYLSTWEYHHQSSHPHFNLPPPHYRVKLMEDDEGWTPDVSNLAKIFHSGTPRFDLLFQKVDNKFSLSSEYLYVSIFKGYFGHIL